MLPEEDLTFPFGKDQFECLPFRTPDGFAGVLLDLIEGFAANSNGTTAIFLKGNGLDSYNSTETVPQLIKRFNFFMEKRRLREGPPEVSIERPQNFVPVTQGAQDALNSPETQPAQGLQEEAFAEAEADPALLKPTPEEEVPVSPPPNGTMKPFPFRVPSRA